jgi:hypothetical protein
MTLNNSLNKELYAVQFVLYHGLKEVHFSELEKQRGKP